ncbi:serine/threonine-protein kinase [Microbacterium sp. SD291]|uniref:serine/threonine-protein kinase n=1 Tax=Microbacterium sp. SD291 TaxID=2782007 RepID=UPI001A96E35B|nr:serine/threonine-protein kinase [Microbacterium sp. SD291]MBO0979152.1 serine/threonine protein kinase [Microbacterium sp. SD291]
MPVFDDQPTEALLDSRYRLIERVGKGGSADVYRAEDVRLSRIVAIKLLRADHESVFGAERVHSETAVLASLHHPSVVTLFDAQLDPGRPQYLVMEYVEGRTLASALDAGPLGAREVSTLACDLAAALGALHARGVVHRDIKPSNVLLGAPVRRGEPWTAKLADFGIAHVLDDPRVTSPGMVVGTAAYMAPEQITRGDPGPASDIYSLGLVLLEALTGAPAFPRTGGVQSALARLSSPPEIPPSLGPRWTLLLTRMTRTDPVERPTAEGVLSAASALAGGGRNAWPFVAGGAAAVGAAAGAVGAAAEAETATFPDETGETKVLPSERQAAGRRSARWFRIGAVALVGAILLIVAVIAGVWALGAAGDPPERHFSGVPFVKTPVSTPSETPAPPSDEGEDDDQNRGKDPKGGDDGEDDPGNSGKDDEEKDG